MALFFHRIFYYLQIKCQLGNLEESNYRYAVELLKDCNILIRMREHIRELKECLENIQEKSTIKMNSISKVNI